MSRALRELGLGPDADERAVKRAYAAKLKTTRPEDDPEGFQRLNAAYQAALAWVQSRAKAAPAPLSMASEMDTGADTTTAEEQIEAIAQPRSEDELPAMLESRTGDTDERLHGDVNDGAFGVAEPDTSDTVLPERLTTETIRFDADAFLNECVALAVRSRDGELLAWLNAQPVLWSLEHKAQIAHWLLRGLDEQHPPIEARRFDELADFFGLLDLNSGYDAYVLHRLRHRLHLRWEIHTQQLRALAQRAGMDGGSLASDLRQTRRILQQVSQPLSTVQAMLAGLVPMYPSAVRRFLQRLDFGNLDDLPAPIDPGQIDFWDAAGDRSRLSVPRLQIGAARCVVYSALAMLLVLAVKQVAPEAPLDVSVAMKTGATVFALMVIGWIALIAGQACLEWQCLPEDEDARFPRLRWALIPLMAVVGLGLDWSLRGDSQTAAVVWLAKLIAMAAFILAWHRYRRRNGPLFGFAPRTPIAFTIGLAVAFGLIVALLDQAPHALVAGVCALALALWCGDLIKQRAAAET